jgi:hypothetical protein
VKRLAMRQQKQNRRQQKPNPPQQNQSQTEQNQRKLQQNQNIKSSYFNGLLESRPFSRGPSHRRPDLASARLVPKTINSIDF